jgi:hypothetical protein
MRLKLATSPAATGSTPALKFVGIVVVAAFTAVIEGIAGSWKLHLRLWL